MRTQEQKHERRATWSVALVGAARTAFVTVRGWKPSAGFPRAAA
jgi:hypothetical protein